MPGNYGSGARCLLLRASFDPSQCTLFSGRHPEGVTHLLTPCDSLGSNWTDAAYILPLFSCLYRDVCASTRKISVNLIGKSSLDLVLPTLRSV